VIPGYHNLSPRLEAKDNMDQDAVGMTVREAGKKGGDIVKTKYGPQFYAEIGRKGGESTKRRHGSRFYEAIGHKGGQRTKTIG
jgi:general stress protein YciG